MVSRITIQDILTAGLILAGYDQQQRNRNYAQRLVWFKANYGAHPLAYCVLWEELQMINDKQKIKHFHDTLVAQKLRH